MSARRISHRASDLKQVEKLLKSKNYGAAAAVLLLWILLSVFAVSSLTTQEDETLQLERIPQAGGKFGVKHVRVCTWNVKNYNVSNRYVGGKWREYPKPEEEKTNLRKVIKAINPDILLIQEMGDLAFLQELRDDLAREGSEYPYCAVTKHNSPSRLAIMSKIEPQRFWDFNAIKIEVQGENRMSARGTLGAEFVVNGARWYAFAVHLKSKQGARKRDEAFIPFRYAEIRGIDEKIFDAVGEGAAVLIAGDFNDEPSEALLRNFKKMPFRLLESHDSDGRQYTYHWEKESKFFRYDYFLTTPAMQRPLRFSGIADTLGASDHKPVYVDLDFTN